MSNTVRSVLAVAMVVGSAALGPPAARGQGTPVTYQQVVRTGEPVPGGAPGTHFRALQVPTIGPDGHVAFTAAMQGGDVLPDDSNASAFFVAGGGGPVAIVARSGSPAPGTDATYGSETPWLVHWGYPVNAAGQIGFAAALRGQAAGDEGLWVGGRAGVALVARAGEPAPDAPADVRFASSAPFGVHSARYTLNDAGQLSFRAALSGSAPEGASGIFAGGPGTTRMVARTDSPAPGAGGATFRTISGPAINDAGAVAFQGQLSGTGVNSNNDQGIWVGPPGALELAVRTGMPAPGTAGNFTAFPVAAVRPPMLNDANQVAFRGVIRDDLGVEKDGVWAGAPNSLALAALRGDPAPGTGRNFYSIQGRPGLNNRGEVAFRGAVEAGNLGSGSFRRGIWAGPAGELELVALEGTAAPLRPGDRPASFSEIERPTLNNAGQVVFRAWVSADDGSFSSSGGYWASDTAGRLHLIAREGEMIDVDGRPRRIFHLDLAGWREPGDGLSTTNGEGVAFNDAGQVAFHAVVAGEFGEQGPRETVIYIATVPEPAAAAGAAASLLLMMRRGARPGAAHRRVRANSAGQN